MDKLKFNKVGQIIDKGMMLELAEKVAKMKNPVPKKHENLSTPAFVRCKWPWA